MLPAVLLAVAVTEHDLAGVAVAEVVQELELNGTPLAPRVGQSP